MSVTLALICDRCKLTIPIELPLSPDGDWQGIRKWAQVSLGWSESTDENKNFCPRCNRAIDEAKERQRKFEEKNDR